MNTQNILTIQLEQSQEDKSDLTVSSNEWEILGKNAYNCISQLKQMKLSVYKEKLNLYKEKCKIKDDVILSLQTCLEAFKTTYLNNLDTVEGLNSKLAEKQANMETIKKIHKDQIAEYEAANRERNLIIETQNSLLKVKDDLIAELEEKLRKQSDLTNNYKEQIIALQTTVEKSESKLSAQETNISDSHKIVHFESKIVNTKQGENPDSLRLPYLAIKELQECLRGKKSTETKMVSLFSLGTFQVAIETVPTGFRWTVIQRRIDKTPTFNQGWFSYVEGFGNLDGDFWIGLDKLYALTKSKPHELYIHLVFANNDVRYAHYDYFAIAGKRDNYRLKLLGNYFGNAGDVFRCHEQCQFSTIRYETKDTVEYNRWWQHRYPACNLNGSFNEKTKIGVWWGTKRDTYQFLESVQMLIRPKERCLH